MNAARQRLTLVLVLQDYQDPNTTELHKVGLLQVQLKWVIPM